VAAKPSVSGANQASPPIRSRHAGHRANVGAVSPRSMEVIGGDVISVEVPPLPK
jgi:hypothetical protein